MEVAQGAPIDCSLLISAVRFRRSSPHKLLKIR